MKKYHLGKIFYAGGSNREVSMNHELENDLQIGLSAADQRALEQPWPDLTPEQRQIRRGRVAMLGTAEQALGVDAAKKLFSQPTIASTARPGPHDRLGGLPRF